jgi:hypothetical protein
MQDVDGVCVDLRDEGHVVDARVADGVDGSIDYVSEEGLVRENRILVDSKGEDLTPRWDADVGVGKET